MGRIISLISSKGGVGKSSFAVMLATSLSNKKRKVLIIEISRKPSSIDMIAGIKIDSLYNLNDILSHSAKPSDAIITSCISENIYMIKSSIGLDKVNLDDLYNLVLGLSSFFNDIILDFDLYRDINTLSKISDDIISIIDINPICVNNLYTITSNCDKEFFGKSKFILNRFDINMFKKSYYNNIDEIIDNLGMQLLGIIPLQRSLLNGYNRNCLLNEKLLLIVNCIRDRIFGKYIPLVID